MGSSGLRHEAFVYESDDQFVDRMAPFVEAGLAEGESILAVTTRANAVLLRDALGSASAEVTFSDRDNWYVHPATTVAAYDSRLSDLVRSGASRIRVVGEVQFGPTQQEWADWMAYEAISNRALAKYPAWIVCPYDARLLPEQVVEGAWRTHPDVHGADVERRGHFDEPEQVLRSLTREHETLSELRSLPTGDDRTVLREQLAAALAAAKVPQGTALKLLVAANEIVDNAFQYAAGPETLRVGLVEGRFVCEISDGGPGFDDPLAGYLPPDPEQGRGAGLWTARQLTSRLELTRTDQGMIVRLWA